MPIRTGCSRCRRPLDPVGIAPAGDTGWWCPLAGRASMRRVSARVVRLPTRGRKLYADSYSSLGSSSSSSTYPTECIIVPIGPAQGPIIGPRIGC